VTAWSSVRTDVGRPGYHFTVPAGWINDPLGVTWHETPEGGRYELFYQSNPDAPVWTPACRWGQATSADLVRWREPRTALEPGPGETGCWSGSVVVDQGRPVIVYTSVVAGSTDLGAIALASGDVTWRHWFPDPGGPVLPSLRPDQGFAHVRDPFVWRDGSDWRMALGAGRSDGRPAVLQYSSADLRDWRLDGVLAEAGPERDGPGGAVWECPQLFPLDGAWVLIVSVWDEGPRGVACAVGDFDGRRFTARSWQPLAADPFYATTAFADSEGRRCVLSWIRHVGGPASGWAGALSVPWLLARDGDRVSVVPHPDVDGLRTTVQEGQGPVALSAEPAAVRIGRQADVLLGADPAGRPLEVAVDGPDGRLFSVTAHPDAGVLRLSAPDRADAVLALRAGTDGGVDLRLLVDDGVVEVFSGGEVAGAVLPPADGDLVLRVAGGAGTHLRHLTLHRMERLTG
jgi:beta-fructofuranosidase